MTWLSLVVLGTIVWGRTIQHLSVEWAVNEQYSYGWAVPFLCAFLFYRRCPPVHFGDPPNASVIPHSALRIPGFIQSVFQHSKFQLSAFLLAFILTRLVGEANPDWRLVSWALSLEAIAMSLVGVLLFAGWPLLRALAFPLVFFLIAVPWPTAIEHATVQTLTRWIIAATVELLNGCGFPATAHGSVIETAGGFVDVDRACSGIRSLQAALVLALFFGELRRFTVPKRLVLCGIAVAMALVFNLVRTFLLSVVAARQGSTAVLQWHDPAGIAILVGCFLSVWGASAWLGRRNPTQRRKDAETQGKMESAQPAGNLEAPQRGPETALYRSEPTSELCSADSGSTPASGVPFGAPPKPPVTPSSIFHRPSPTPDDRPLSTDNRPLRSPVPHSALRTPRFVWPSGFQSSAFQFSAFLFFLLLGETAVYLWYATASLHPSVRWAAELPRTNPTFKPLELPPAVLQILRFNESDTGAWQNSDGTAWQMVYFRWKPGRTAAALARGHTPDICLPAAGRTLRELPEVPSVRAGPLMLPFRAYATENNGRPSFIFYTLWEDGPSQQRLGSESLTRQARIRAVLDQRRNSGQRVVQIAITGARDAAHAENLLRSELPSLIRIQSSDH